MTGCRFNRDVEMEEKSGLKVVNLTKGRVAANYLWRENESFLGGDYLLTCVKVTRTAIRRVRIEPAKQGKKPGK